jgi:hypothetical protein
LYSKSDIKLSDIRQVSGLFESKAVTEVTETAAFSTHMDNLMCRVLPLVTTVGKQQYTPNAEYMSMLEALDDNDNAAPVAAAAAAARATRSKASAAAAAGSKRKGSSSSSTSSTVASMTGTTANSKVASRQSKAARR